MDAKLFRSFTPVINTAPKYDAARLFYNTLENREAEDPVGASWQAAGFIRPIEGDEFLLPIDGAGHLACVQINERNLPGAVIKEAMIEKAAKTEDLTGRKPGKKEMAQIRDEVELDLLPKAFIKRKLVPILFAGNKLFVFSSSGKVVDHVLALLNSVADMDDMFKPVPVSVMVEKNIEAELTYLAREGQSETTDTEGESEINYLTIGNVGVVRGPNKQKISISEKDMASDDIAKLLEDDSYTVIKLGVEHMLAGSVDADSSFILNDKLVFSKFILAGAVSARGKDKKDADTTLIGTAWLVTQGASAALDTVIGFMGGLRATVKPSIDTPTTMSKEASKEADEADEDDEL